MRRLAPFMTAAALFVSASAALAQPPFPHYYHVQEEEIECADCHVGVEDSRSSADNLLPDPEFCLDCHDQGDVRLEWPAAEREFDFDHAYHINQLGAECADCHQGLLEETVRSAGYLPAMDDCMTCHNGMAAPRECAACHSTDRALLAPASHTAGWVKDHGFDADMPDASCMPCHTVSDCQECHDGALLVKRMALGASAQPLFAAQLEGNGNVGEAVHGLNFRFLHGLEARGRASDCLTCHELDSGDFCAECHNPAGSAALRPVWHGVGNWVTLGVGSGGGRHAELARRDIENCAVCHDSRGTDPTCLQCHMDRLPGLGNDPSTHAADFADDIGEGDFHSDAGAMCFTCHTQSTAPDGFCAYCHEAP